MEPYNRVKSVGKEFAYGFISVVSATLSCMILAITGTPGTGKTTVAPVVADELDCELVDLNEFIKQNGISDEYDEERNSAMVDTDELNAVLQDELVGDDNVVEGHLAHFLEFVDLVIVLRTDPEELTERLEAKGWDEKKVEENVMAERLDNVLQEAANLHAETTFEVDTTDRDPGTVAEEIVYLVEHPQERSLYTPGGTEWDMEML